MDMIERDRVLDLGIAQELRAMGNSERFCLPCQGLLLWPITDQEERNVGMVRQQLHQGIK